jgi:hypothetical protein
MKYLMGEEFFFCDTGAFTFGHRKTKEKKARVSESEETFAKPKDSPYNKW